MKNFKMLKIKIFKGVIKPKEFLILFGLFFSSLAFAGTLTVTWEAGKIPGGNNHFEGGNPGCRSSTNGELLDLDRTEDPNGVAFSDDGLTVFTSNATISKLGDNHISQNRLDRPFDLTSDRVDFNPNANCDDLDGLDTHEVTGGALNNAATSIDVVNNGKTFFVLDGFGQLGKFNAVTPNDVDGIVYETKISFSVASGKWIGDSEIENIAFSRDGTKVFTLSSRTGTTDARDRQLSTFSLPGPFDISSYTLVHQVDFFDLDVTDDGDVIEIGRGIEFNQDGSAMFLLVGNTDENDETDLAKNYIYQFSLSKNFDVSTATKVGRLQLGLGTFGNRASDSNGMPRGFTFASNGMKLFILDNRPPASAVDQINQFRLECPFGIVQCTSDPSASVDAQVELAKQNISLNVNTIFKRFEWIKRNRDDENLSAHNFKINYEDPLLKTLANKFEPSVRNNFASFVSKHKTTKKKSNWSSWSLADISLSIFGKDGTKKAKDINTRGLTIGADRKFGDNKFLGWAIRYSDSSSDIKLSSQDLTMESLTLNLYGILPSKDNQYINAVVGLSHLRFDHRYVGNLSGERKGKQAFASINYRTKDKYGILNVTPTGKLTYGVTRLSEFTDFLGKASGLSSQDVIYKEDTFVNGEFAGGFLFETDIIVTSQGTLQPMGGIEILYDLTNDLDYKYVLQGKTHVNKETIHSPFSRQNLKTSFGFEAVHLNGFTVSADYQRLIRLNDTKKAPEYQTETFILKFSRSKEEDNQFALNYDPINAHQTNLSYSKNIHGLDFKINSNQSLENSSEYFTNLEVSGKF
ncbi:autotransporter outer membrane beta-barrel domain-containing protein [Candidatus Pelagibacter sp.]|nr:autotransporter outer membrane beta-barrel domain-containing protein [Candidatus Pelagibacter sp.]